MEIRWARLAAVDLDRIFEHIRKENPVAAGEVVQAIYDGCGSLKDFPQRGRPSRMIGRRELVFASFPYIAVYRVRENAIEIIRIYHAAQNWL
jgi:addiction module RelE/StbE family toxin